MSLWRLLFYAQFAIVATGVLLAMLGPWVWRQVGWDPVALGMAALADGTLFVWLGALNLCLLAVLVGGRLVAPRLLARWRRDGA